MPATARSTLLRELTQDIFPEDYVEFSPTSATGTTVVADELIDSDASANTYDGGYVYVYNDTGAGQWRRIVTYAPSTGTLTVARSWATNPNTTSDCFVYLGPLDPVALIRHLNASLRRLRRQRLVPITLITDGTMDASGTTDWTATSAAPLTKVTTAPEVAEGVRSLFVDNSGVDGRARSALVNCIPNETIVVEAVVRVGNTSGAHTATLRAQDETAAASIGTVTTTNRERTRLRLVFTIPSGAFQFSIRLEGSAATTDTYWDEVICWRPYEYQFRLPSDIERFDQVVAVRQRRSRGGSPSGTSGAYAAYAVDYQEITGWKVLADPTATTPLLLDLHGSSWSSSAPVLVDCLLPWAQLTGTGETGEDETTYADQDDVVFRARALAYAQLARVGPRDDRKFYQAQADRQAITWENWARRQPRPARPVGRRR